MRSSFQVRGVGLHTGETCEITVRPAPIGHGIVFDVRGERVAVKVQNLASDVPRCTTLLSGGVQVRTVEHLLAAAALLGETDLRIFVSGEEVPILDGSAIPWCRLFRAHGARARPRLMSVQSADAEHHFTLGASIALVRAVSRDADAWIEVCADLSDVGRPAAYHRFYPAFDEPEDIAAARTFAFEHEVAHLQENGLAAGGTLDNALVINSRGALNPGGFRFENEPVRHKLLDAVGDLSLLGGLPRAQIRLHRPGHRFNHMVVRFLVSKIASSG